MQVPVWVADLAAEFWEAANCADSFPRTLRQAVRRVAPFDVIDRQNLDLEEMRAWLAANGVRVDISRKNRPLRAGLVVRRGVGFAFVDAGDPEDERRFSLAHEIGHYLRDYWRPSRIVRKRIGKEALEALDGVRESTAEERFHAIVGQASLGFHIHLLDRDDHGKAATPSILQAEDDADRIAYELLAPAADVEASLSKLGEREAKKTVAALLRNGYGLPAEHADRYASILMPAAAPSDPLLLAFKTASGDRRRNKRHG